MNQIVFKGLYKLCKSYGIYITTTICTASYFTIMFCNDGLMMMFLDENMWSLLILNVAVVNRPLMVYVYVYL